MGTIGNPRDYLILTNNPLVPACMEGKGLYTIDFRPELSYREILTLVRDKVYLGHTLYTHPLAGSVKPNETPFRSVALTEEPGPLDLESLELIEKALGMLRQFKPRFQRGEDAPPDMREDFAEIDYRLIDGALASQTEGKI